MFSFNPTTNSGSIISCSDNINANNNIRPANGTGTQAANACSNYNAKFLKVMLFETYLEFDEFAHLFKSFYIHMRKDLKEIFDRYAILVNSKNTDDQNIDRTWQSTRKLWKSVIYKNYSQRNQADAGVVSELSTFTRNNFEEELPVINGFRNFFNTTMPTTTINANSVQANKELHRQLLFQLQNQILGVNNNRFFYDLIASNSISPYSVNCSSDLLLLNYFSQVSMSLSPSQAR